MPDPGSPWERENPEDGFGYTPLIALTIGTHKIEGAFAYQAAKTNRQIMYQFSKMVPDYRRFYEDAEAFYRRLCVAMGVDHEPVFDEDEYKKSQHYQDLVSGRRA